MRRRHALTLSLALVVGCAAPPRDTDWPPEVVAATRPAPPAGPVQTAQHLQPAPAGPLDLNALVTLATQRSPDLAAAAARVAEAQGQFIQAGLYPNPTVGYMASEINSGPGTAGQQGVFASQEIVRGGKLQVARQAAGHGLSAAEWQATTRWFETLARVKAAYYEYQAARAVLRESEQIATEFETGLKRAEELAKGGIAFTYEVSRFRVELTQAQNRAGAARERVAAAERNLAAVAGVPALPGSVADEEFPPVPPELPFDQAAAAADNSSSVREASAAVEQAREQVRLATLQNVPDLQLQAGVMYDFEIQAPMAQAQAGVMLPIWNKNQGNIHAAHARLAATTTGVEQARLRLRERLAAAFQKYHNARRQAELYKERVIPDAEAALGHVERVFNATGQRFFETLDARRVLAQSRIDHLQALGEAWQALAEIEAITQPHPPARAGEAAR